MKTLVNKITAFIADEQGAETVEWVIIAAALAAILVVVFGPTGTLKTAIDGAMLKITNALK